MAHQARPSRIVAILAALLITGACGGSGHLTGRVTQVEGGPLAGAKITIDGLKVHQEVVADAEGRFELTGIAAGAYSLVADLPGFSAEVRRRVQVTGGATTTADFVLHPACLEEGSYVDLGMAWGLQAAQEVLHVRIGASMPPDRWIANDLCVVGVDHTATVISILNMGPDSKSIPKTIHIVKDGRVPFPMGAEYIAFVRWEPGIGRYRPIAGPIFMIPLHDDKIEWTRTDAPTIHDGQNASEAMAALFALLPAIRSGR